MNTRFKPYPVAALLAIISIPLLDTAATALPSADSITSCTISEGGVDKGSNYSITIETGVVPGTQPLISVIANDSTKYVGFEQGYVLKTSPTGTLFTGSQSINVFSSATFTNFDLTWYVDSQKFVSGDPSYPATTHGFQYRLFAVKGTYPYSYDSSLDTPLCTLTYYITPPGGDPDSGSGGSWDIDPNHYLAKAESALPDTV